jgi:hypothetical protein
MVWQLLQSTIPPSRRIAVPHRMKHWSPEQDEQLREMVADGEDRSMMAMLLHHSVSETEKRMHILKLEAKTRRES